MTMPNPVRLHTALLIPRDPPPPTNPCTPNSLTALRRPDRGIPTYQTAGANITHRLRLAGSELPLFEPPAVEALFQASRGLPRQINRVAHYALWAAALDSARTVNHEHLQRALDDLRP